MSAAIRFRGARLPGSAGAHRDGSAAEVGQHRLERGGVAAAEQLVIVSTVREDTAASAAWLLDGLREKGFDQKIDTLPSDSSIAWRKLDSAIFPSTSASTSGASG